MLMNILGQSSRESHSPMCTPGLIDESRTSSDQGLFRFFSLVSFFFGFLF